MTKAYRFNRLFRCNKCSNGMICRYSDIEKCCYNCGAPFSDIHCFEEFKGFYYSPSMLDEKIFHKNKYMHLLKKYSKHILFNVLALIVLMLIAMLQISSIRNAQKLCKTHDTYIVNGTTYSCDVVK